MFFLKRDRNRGSLNLELALLIGVLVVGSAIGLAFLGKEISNSFLAAGGSLPKISLLSLDGESGDGAGGTGNSLPADPIPTDPTDLIGVTGFGPGGHYTSESAPAPITSHWSFYLNDDGISYSARRYLGRDTVVSVPYEYKGLPVTRIGVKYAADGAVFRVMTAGDGTPIPPVTTVYVPDTITSIGKYAFDGSISGDYAITSVQLPNTITEITDWAFQYSKITAIEIPNSVKTIGQGAFSNCAFTSVTLPKNLTTIGLGAFEKCVNLTSIIIPNSVTSCDNGAFAACTKLTSATLSNSMTKISSTTFYNCRKLTSITIPNNIVTIDSYAFGNCTALTSVTLPEGLTTINADAFTSCSALLNTNIPLSATTVAAGAFRYCANTTVKIPAVKASTWTAAYLGCKSVTTY